jgi:hypothetical protein
MSEMRKDVAGNLAWGLGIVVLALVSVQARKLGWVEPDTVTRLVIGANGLFVAWIGNRMPKSFVPGACARRARRVAGAQRAGLRGTGGGRADSGGLLGRGDRDPHRHRGDAGLLPVAAPPGEGELTGRG